MPPPDIHDLLPGARDDAGLEPDNHGVTAILDVVQRLAAADVPSCVVGVRALRYYGAGRVTNVFDLLFFFLSSYFGVPCAPRLMC